MIKRRLVTFSFSPSEEKMLNRYSKKHKINKSRIIKLALYCFLNEKAGKEILNKRSENLERIKKIQREIHAIKNKIVKLHSHISNSG